MAVRSENKLTYAAYHRPHAKLSRERRAEQWDLTEIKWYRRPDKTQGITWPTLQADIAAFVEVLNQLSEHLMDPYANDTGYRVALLPELSEYLVNESPLFAKLARTRGRRPEDVAAHTWQVNRMAVTATLSSKMDVFRSRIQQLYHDTGKALTIGAEMRAADGQTEYRLGSDPYHDHAFFSAAILDELLYQVGLQYPEWSDFLNPVERKLFWVPVLIHHGLEDVAEERIQAQDFVSLIRDIPDVFVNSVVLMFADLGAAGKTEYIAENTIAMVEVLDAYIALRQERGDFAESEAFEKLIAQSLSRVFYEMNQPEAWSISSTNEQAVVDKIEAITTTIRLIFGKLEAFSEVDEAGKDRLVPIIATAVERLLADISEKLDANFRELYDRFVKILGGIFEQFSIPLLITLQQSPEKS